jgi:hypothetical protein
VVGIGRLVVHAQVELVLVHVLVRDPAVVVGGAGQVRQRITAQQVGGHRIDAVRRDRVPGEGIARRAAAGARAGGGRIVDGGHAAADRLGEDALSLQGGGDGGDADAADALAHALVVDEEERPVLGDGPAQDEAELVAAEAGLVGVTVGRGREQVARVHVLVTEELERRAPELIRPRPRAEVDDAAVEAPELRRRDVGHHLELLDGVDDREVGHRSGLGLQDGDAVVQVLVDAGPPAVEAREGGPGRERHARNQRHQREEAAAVQRELQDEAVGDHLAQARRLRLQQGRVGGHRRRLAHVADRELDVQAHALAGRDVDAVPHEALEARRFHHEGVGPWREPGERVEAGRARRGDVLAAGRDVAGGHLRLGHVPAGRVVRLAHDLAPAGLGEADGRPADGESEQADGGRVAEAAHWTPDVQPSQWQVT